MSRIADVPGAIVKNLSPGDHFAQITRSFCQDHSLSIATRSMLLDLFSRPSDWNISVSGIMATMGMGRDQVRKALKEADDAGYAYQHCQRDAAGRLAAPTWFVSCSKPAIKRLKRQLNSGFSQEYDLDIEPETENQALEQKSQNHQALKTSNWSPGPENQGLDNIKSTNTRNRLTDSRDTTEDAASAAPAASPPKSVSQPASPSERKASPRQTRMALTSDEQRIAAADQADQDRIDIKRKEETAALRAYNALAREVGLDIAPRLHAQWREKLRQILDLEGDWPGMAEPGRLGVRGFLAALEKIRNSPYCLGKTEKGRPITFNSMLGEDFITKLMAGVYDDRSKPAGKTEGKDPRKRWEARMKIWHQNGRSLWSTTEWGPVPGTPGCQVPADLLAEYAVETAA